MTPLSVYVHVPFCVVKCGYCDFNTYAGMDALKPRYRDAVLAEVASSTALFEGRDVVSIGFGGGTPGELPAATIDAIIAAIRAHADVAADAEVTLEANPGTADGAHFAALRQAGVTRLSLGAQTFDAAALRFLDRIHSVEAIGASVRSARVASFSSLNLDLMYGLPGQSIPAWREDLEQALRLGTDHLSLYALTVEEGTPLHRRVERGDITMPGEDALADLYDFTCETLEREGFDHYEVSNWARPGHRSRHNIGYWTSRDYLGIGAGAHGFVDGERYENIAHPRAYIDAAVAGGLPRADAYRPTGATAMADWLSLRLRLLDGFPRSHFEEEFGISLDDAAGPVLDQAIAAGLLADDAPLLRLTKRGYLLHGEITARLLRHIEDHLPLEGAATR